MTRIATVHSTRNSHRAPQPPKVPPPVLQVHLPTRRAQAGAGGATSSSDELSSLLLSSSDELGSGGGGAGAFFFLVAPGFLATLLVVRFVGAIVNAVLLLCSAVCGRLGSA